MFKIFKNAPTYFGSQGIHHQGAVYSAWLKLQLWFYRVRRHGRSWRYGNIFARGACVYCTV
jgi:hypothetical protein